MSASLIPWRSCEVQSYRYQGIGTIWTNSCSDPRGFAIDMSLIRRYGVKNDRDGHRFVLARDSRGDLCRIDPSQIDWTGFEEAFAAQRAA